MKIEIYLSYEKISTEIPAREEIRPRTSCKMEISEDEMNYLRRSHKELFEAISRLINFSVQFME